VSVPRSRANYTTEEYLTLEREAGERHEYLDGEIYAMAGESVYHGAICTNITGEVRAQLKGSPCQAFAKDMKVRSGPLPLAPRSTKGMFSYPDIVIVCGEPQFLDQHRDVIINPAVIIEVLSPNTEAFDRGEKFWRYRSFNPSLTDYLVVAQDRPSVDHFARRPNEQWVIGASVHELSERVIIASVGCALSMAEIYDRVTFPSPSEADTKEALQEERLLPAD
jgi:Uma2 family endonuclease